MSDLAFRHCAIEHRGYTTPTAECHAAKEVLHRRALTEAERLRTRWKDATAPGPRPVRPQLAELVARASRTTRLNREP